MYLKCFLYPGWEPRIRSASSRRAWMDETPESFAYRCLPLAMANSHGWELLSPCGFEAEWNGGAAVDDVSIRLDPGAKPTDSPIALFGQATLTFHVAGLFRTPPGWNLWVGGPPNSAKDGISPLAGVIETDWSPYTFTMNWRFTRANHPIRFEENETIAFFMPVQRFVVDHTEPQFLPIDDCPELKTQFDEWSASRDAFHVEMRERPPTSPSDKWQKLYYRGACPDGTVGSADHQTKLRASEFARKTDV